MDLTPGQQRLVFVVVVVALAGLGIYLVGNRSSGGAPAAAPSAPASTPAPAAGTASGVPPSALPTAVPLATSGSTQIYQWLPFSAADLSAAAQTTQAFARAYATWSYTEDKAAYGAKLSGLVTAPEAQILEGTYATPGVAGPRTADKQVSTGTGTINSIQTFGSGPVSITFYVTINQKVTSTQPATTQDNQYAVTVGTSGGGVWQVSDIELKSLGNQGQGQGQ
jgi:hypothetical protein